MCARLIPQDWSEKRNPVTRFREYLERRGWWDEEKEQEAQTVERKVVMDALLLAESKEKPPVNELFEDVYDSLTPNLERQWADLQAHIAKYPDHYAPGNH